VAHGIDDKQIVGFVLLVKRMLELDWSASLQ
jgi:hypothetical protein